MCSAVDNASLSDVGVSFFAKFVEFHAVMFKVGIIIHPFLFLLLCW